MVAARSGTARCAGEMSDSASAVRGHRYASDQAERDGRVVVSGTDHPAWRRQPRGAAPGAERFYGIYSVCTEGMMLMMVVLERANLHGSYVINFIFSNKSGEL